jgi:C4-dicarboxylate-specific signal transduction histidine kinase
LFSLFGTASYPSLVPSPAGLAVVFAFVTLTLLALTIIFSLIRRRFDVQSALRDVAREDRWMMGELTASIVHEIKQPLAAIVTNAEFCLRNLAGGTPNHDQLREAMIEIANDGNRASSIISGIRALLFKGTHEGCRLNSSQLVTNQLIRDVLEITSNEITRNHVAILLDLAADLPLVLGDRIQLQQVLINVVTNGIEAMRGITVGQRELLIRSFRKNREVLIEVQDSGPGVKPEDVERIFEPFFTTRPEGIGMGLSISRSMIESHGGRIWTVPISRGALFAISLPLDVDDVA